MTIKTKPIESLRIQAKSFLNYSKKNNKYKKIIYELMCMDDEDFENCIQNSEETKSFLISKWIKEELINNFENDCKEYILSDKYYYWPINDYSKDIIESIKKNDELMRRMKWLILSISKNKSLLDIPEFIKKTIQFNTENTDEETDYDFSLISEITEEIHKYYWKMINCIIQNLISWNNTKEIIRETNENIKKYILEIKDIIENNFNQLESNLQEHFIETIIRFFDWNVIKNVLINKYICLYFHWNTNIDSLRRKNWYIPTIYTRNTFDAQILQEATKEDIKIDRITDKLWKSVDDEFLDDTFIHQSNFRVLEDIINEWWLISSNELERRSKINEHIKQTKNSFPTAEVDKDIFFTRWFTNYEYWHSENLEDVVYFSNTMRQFWIKWYMIPINADTQNSRFTEVWCTRDAFWYTILSQSALEDEDSYSKINIDDLYIFMHKNKKEKVEQMLSNMWEDEKNKIHIIYIPENIYTKNSTYKTNNSSKITEFIRNYLNTQIRQKPKIIPKNKINRDDIIKSSYYNMDIRDNIRVNCECAGEEDNQKKHNELKDLNDELLLKIYQRYVWKDTNINQEIINKIWSINPPIENYPTELIKFSIMLICWKIDEWGEKLKNFFVFLRKEWYSQKDISILWFIHDFILLSNWTREFGDREKYWGLWKFCNNWDINYQDMKKFLIDLWNILDIEDVWEIIKLQENGELISKNEY